MTSLTSNRICLFIKVKSKPESIRLEANSFHYKNSWKILYFKFYLIICGGVKISNSNRALGIKEVIIIIVTLFIGLPISYLMWNDVGLGTLFIILVIVGIFLGVVLLYFI